MLDSKMNRRRYRNESSRNAVILATADNDAWKSGKTIQRCIGFLYE